MGGEQALAVGHVAGLDLLEVVGDERIERIAGGGSRFIGVGHGSFLRRQAAPQIF